MPSKASANVRNSHDASLLSRTHRNRPLVQLRGPRVVPANVRREQPPAGRPTARAVQARVQEARAADGPRPTQRPRRQTPAGSAARRARSGHAAARDLQGRRLEEEWRRRELCHLFQLSGLFELCGNLWTDVPGRILYDLLVSR